MKAHNGGRRHREPTDHFPPREWFRLIVPVIPVLFVPLAYQGARKPCYEVASPAHPRHCALTRARRDGNPADHLVYKNSRPQQPDRNRPWRPYRSRSFPAPKKKNEILPGLTRVAPPSLLLFGHARGAASTWDGGDHLVWERLGQGWGPLTS